MPFWERSSDLVNFLKFRSIENSDLLILWTSAKAKFAKLLNLKTLRALTLANHYIRPCKDVKFIELIILENLGSIKGSTTFEIIHAHHCMYIRKC
jgi:hypothetical protein